MKRNTGQQAKLCGNEIQTKKYDATHMKQQDPSTALDQLAKQALSSKSLVFVGLMGAGKSAIGRRIATKLDLPFLDADNEIEAAAGKTISDIFQEDGEPYFRDREEKVIERLLIEGPCILATGGGAFISQTTRQLILSQAISVWLKADLDVLMERVGRRDHRPLLKTQDPRAVMQKLMDDRYPIYAQANITIESRNVPHEVIVNEIIEALAQTN